MSAAQNQPRDGSVLALAEQQLAADAPREALRSLGPLLEADPRNVSGLHVKARALRALGDRDGAAQAFEQMVRTDPGNEDGLIGLAWSRHEAHRAAEAADLWKAARTRFPENPAGFYGGGGALVALKRYNDAEAVLAEGVRRFPFTPHMYEGYARLAAARGDHAMAVRRWAAFQRLLPQLADSYVEIARGLAELNRPEEAEAALELAPPAARGEVAWIAARAELAARRGDLREALAAWEEATHAHPGAPEGYLGACDALCGMSRFEDAEAALAPALRMFPRNLEVARRHAWLAHYRMDWREADARWSRLRAAFPGDPLGHVGGVASRRAAGARDEAEALGREGLARFPGDLWLRIELARLASDAQDWARAAEFYGEALRLHPHELVLYRELADALVAAGLFEPAEQTIAEARRTIGANVGIACAAATVATRRRDETAAVERWREAVRDFPDAVEAHLGLVGALGEFGRFDLGETAVKAAVVQFPTNLQVRLAWARLLSAKRDWARALPMWADLKRVFPADRAVKSALAEALWQARLDQPLAVGADAFQIPPALLAPEPQPTLDAQSLQKLFMKFESIGDTCEFGIVQRRFGAEPISLLRWTSTEPDALVAALDQDLAGVGDPEHTLVEAIEGEYTTRDRRYHMFSHTFTPETSAPPDVFLAQQCRRLQFLRGKFLDDLREPAKIYVYKSDSGLTDAQARRLRNALARHGGKPWLLCMRLVEGARAPGEVEAAGDGLFFGWIDRFSTVDVNVPAWIAACQAMAARWDARS